MKKCLIFFCLFFVLCVSLFGAEEPDNEPEEEEKQEQTEEEEVPLDLFEYEVGFQASSGFLLAGETRDFCDKSLEPKPDFYYTLGLELNLTWFFLDYMGLELNFSPFTLIYAQTRFVQQPMIVYENLFMFTGPVFRLPFDMGSGRYLSLYVSGGMNLCFLRISRYLAKLFSDTKEFDEIDPALGWYAKTGIKYTISAFLFVGFEIRYIYHNSYFRGSSDQMDGHYIDFPVILGLGF